jgi:hypothetical protein
MAEKVAVGGRQPMYPENKMVGQALIRLGMLVTIVVFVLSACSGGRGGEELAKAKEGAKLRSLPEYEKALRPGEYRTEEFKPSFSITVGKSWANNAQELPDLSNWNGKESQDTYASRTSRRSTNLAHKTWWRPPKTWSDGCSTTPTSKPTNPSQL